MSETPDPTLPNENMLPAGAKPSEVIEKIEMPKVLIGVPCYRGDPDVQMVMSLLKVMQHLRQEKVEHDIFFMYGTGINHARNKIAEEFIASEGFTHLLFWDDDIVIEADLPVRLLNTGRGLVGVPYVKKKMNSIEYTVRITPVVNVDINQKNLVEVEGLGTGMMLIRRDVIEALAAKVPKYSSSENPEAKTPLLFIERFFENDPMLGVPTLMSEDLQFCKMAKDNNIRTWAYVDEFIYHVGKYAYGGNYSDILRSLAPGDKTMFRRKELEGKEAPKPKILIT